MVPSRHLWVGRCHSTSKQHLERVFSNFGVIEGVSYDRTANFAFVDFEDTSSAMRAYETMQGMVVGARKVQLAFGRADEEMQDSDLASDDDGKDGDNEVDDDEAEEEEE